MNYDEASAYIESLAPTILNPDLARFAAFMKVHGAPQNSYKSLHVAGTNGKGSTVAIVDSVLRASGFKVGRFTGPHLLRWNERFHFNGKPIDDDNFARLVSTVRERSEAFGRKHPDHGALTWFEVLTAVAFFWFAEMEVDFAVFEVGLGGRWDATNVLEHPVVSGITTIDYDHMHILGSTLGEIAGEKAGIIKPGIPVVTGTTGDAFEKISARAAELNSPLISCRAPNLVTGPEQMDIEAFDQAVGELALVGNYQRFNALIAYVILQVCKNRTGLDVTARLSDGFKRAYWPGRFQWLPDRSLILDGAHNVAGARALRSALDEHFPDRPRAFVLSFYQNKDVPGALQHLIRPQDRVIVSQAKSTRAVVSPATIVDKVLEIGARAEATDSVGAALNRAFETRADNELIVATGSFATVKESMLAMGWRSVEEGIKIHS
jgi:dihydrofolate synthase/folylpolyglutamate synthase